MRLLGVKRSSFLGVLFFVAAIQSQDQGSDQKELINGCKLESTSVCAKLEFVRRREWQTSYSGTSQYLRLPVQYVIVHGIERETPPCQSLDHCKEVMERLRYHDVNNQGLSDIRYNWVIGGDGRVYEGKGWGYRGEHVGANLNPKSLSVGILGSYATSKLDVETECLILNVISCGVSKGVLARNYSVHAHSDVACTSCPGKELRKQLKRWPRYRGKLDSEYTCE